MTYAALRPILDELGWSLNFLAKLLDRPPTSVTNWSRRSGRYSVPNDVAAWLQRRLDAHRQAMRDDPAPVQK